MFKRTRPSGAGFPLVPLADAAVEELLEPESL
jgi:hypothetical protein